MSDEKKPVPNEQTAELSTEELEKAGGDAASEPCNKIPSDPCNKLSDAELSKVSGGAPTESVSLSYEKIEWKYTTQKTD